MSPLRPHHRRPTLSVNAHCAWQARICSDLEKLEAGPSISESQLSQCRELVRRTHRRVVENHLVAHQSMSVTRSDDVTVGIMFEELSQTKAVVIRDILVGGPAWMSKQLQRGDVVAAIDGVQCHGDATIQALQGSRIAGGAQL